APVRDARGLPGAGPFRGQQGGLMARTLNILVVDDSAVVREAMQTVFAAAGDISVATAPDAVVARRRIAAVRPDVIVLDLEMPREDGLTFLRNLMATDPIP